MDFSSKITTKLKQNKLKSLGISLVILAYLFCLPASLFDKPLATVIQSKEGHLLGARIADDGQWRFPSSDSIPTKFEQCILAFEDGYFYKHPGFNPISISKALKANWAKGKIVRGGSTITQQVIRLSREGKHRTYFEKIIELIQATRLEFSYSKKEILNLYISNAPFGGNVVGLETASWRYFNRSPHELSWAENATLAVLPNAPGLIYPGKNHQKLIKKRNRLLSKLVNEKIIDTLTYQLAIQEELPNKPYPLPQLAPHLLQEITKKNKGKKVTTSIPLAIQQQVNRIVKQHHHQHQQNGVHNMAILVLDVKTKKVLSYVGNTSTSVENQKDVNIINAARSTGSVLKPLLYMALLDKGEILPHTLIPDIPTSIADYKPKNFNLKYAGAISAKEALAKSLNIPAVRMLQQYGLTRFYHELGFFKMKHINKGVDHYGLSLILGGAESNLWDLCNTYASLASTVTNYTQNSGQYYNNEFAKASYFNDYSHNYGQLTFEKNIFDAGSIYLGFEAMKEVNRPETDQAWKFYDSAKEIAWKTGTSFGNRDAWAIGITQNIVVGVWVGNADGEGRPNLTGVKSAAPVLFDVFNLFPKATWFNKPHDELTEAIICKSSGYLAIELCDTTSVLIPRAGNRFKPCPYHHLVHLNKSQTQQVNTSCAPLDDIITKSWFSLPPVQEWYFKRSNPNYKSLPPFKKGCFTSNKKTMAFIFPNQNQRIILAKNELEQINPVIFKIAHSRPQTVIYWYMDNEFIQSTTTFHEIAVTPNKGKHVVTAVDELGNEVIRNIVIE